MTTPAPSGLGFLQQQAVAAYRGGRLKDALQFCREMLKQLPDRPDVLSFAGMIALEMGDAAEAAALYGRAVRRRPDFVEAHYNLGNALMKLGRSEAAVAAYRRAAELKPDLVAAHNNLGNALHALGRNDEAAEAYRRVLRLAPDSPEVQRNLGIALERAGKRGDAIDAYRAVIAQRPDWLLAHSNLANALLSAGDARAAVAAADRWLTLAPGNIEALSIKTLALYEAGEREAAAYLLDFRLVRRLKIEPPPGFASLKAFNRALVDITLLHPTLHVPEAADPHYHHPALAITKTFFGPSEGPVAAFEAIVRRAVADYIAAIPPNSRHPFLVHPPKTWEFASWAAVLHFQGNLTPHIHLDGYLSGVYYPQLPDLMGTAEHGQAGFFELGPPPEQFPLTAAVDSMPIRPEEGLMILFPSYFYHRTIPFESTQRRISIAFDACPRSSLLREE
ncbi:MAG TPA: tetratricopeptide repeat protein [Stellaceae bacterium]|nr:tetratricopeptide repeat protein [Stellaceae bacterium]